MSGKAKQKVYQYTAQGKFIQEFESETSAAIRCYGSKRPLFQTKDYHLTINTILVKEKIGRDAVKKLFRKINSPFITTRSDDKIIECLNLNNEVIATYKGLHIASLLSNVAKATIFNQLKNNKCSHTNIDLIFRYK